MPLEDPRLALGVALLALLAALVLLVRLSRLGRAHRALVAGDPGASFVQAVERMTAATRSASAETRALKTELGRVSADLATALRHVAVVRFDAFGDTGGRQSFSAALLDDGGNGLVVSSITGRTESRTYCKGIVAGGCEQPLSPEELEAVGRATRRP